MSSSFLEYHPIDRFLEMAKTNLAKDMWHYLIQMETIQKMIVAIKSGETPLLHLDKALDQEFSKRIEAAPFKSDDLRVMTMNMMKQILEKQGYRHIACCLVPEGKFVRSAGVFQKNEE